MTRSPIELSWTAKKRGAVEFDPLLQKKVKFANLKTKIIIRCATLLVSFTSQIVVFKEPPSLSVWVIF